jgi:lipopolysaccharide export system ATP-binding protein
MTSPVPPIPPSEASEITSLVARAVHAEPALAVVVSAIIEGADVTGTVPLQTVSSRFLAHLPEGTHMSPEEVRSHLAAAVLPRLAASGLVQFSASGAVGPDAAVRIDPTLWPALQRYRAEVAHLLQETSLQHNPSAAPAVTRRPVSATASVLSAEGLVKVYRGRRVVNDVALRVAQGEIVGLLGPNGAGKTTTFYMLVGLIAPQAGGIRMDGTDITGMPMYERARKGIGYLSQEPSIFRKLTVEQNITAILETLSISADERKARLETLLDELSIKHLRNSRAYQLSGGERRRLEITRALVTQPKFMMLDEPFAGVDPIAVHDIQTIVAGLRHRGIGVLISDHNVEQTLDIVDRAYIMFDGQVKVSGTVRELVFDDTVAEIYLGPTLTARLRARFAEADEGVLTE